MPKTWTWKEATEAIEKSKENGLSDHDVEVLRVMAHKISVSPSLNLEITGLGQVVAEKYQLTYPDGTVETFIIEEDCTEKC